MNNSEYPQKMRRLFTSAWPDIKSIPWAQYGAEVETHVYAGNFNHRGMLLQIAGYDMEKSKSQFIFGELPNQSKSEEKAQRMTIALESHSKILSSLEVRQPPAIWGGAVRESDNQNKCAVIEGPPELGGHIMLSTSMRICGNLTEIDWETVIHREDDTHSRAAKRLIGMSDDQYTRLVLETIALLTGHARKIEIIKA